MTRQAPCAIRVSKLERSCRGNGVASGDIVIVVREDGTCAEVSPLPPPPGFFTSDEPRGRDLEEIISPIHIDAFLKAFRQSRAGGVAEFRCALTGPQREYVFSANIDGTNRTTFLGRRVGFEPGRSLSAAPPLTRTLDALDMGVLVANAEGDLIVVNHRAQELLGMSEVQVVGSNPSDPRYRAIRPDGSPFPAHERPMVRALNSRKPVRGEIVGIYLAASDAWGWLKVDAVPDFDEQGRLSHIVVTLSNITDSVKAARELEREEELLREVMFASAGGVIVIEPPERVAYINPAAREIMGLPSELSSSEVLVGFCEEDGAPADPRWLDQLRYGRNAERVSDLRRGYRRPDGELRILSTTLSPVFDDRGKVERLVVTVTDITTSSVAAREATAVREKMEELGRIEALTSLAGGVAHDYNNLLVGMLGAVSLARDELPSDHEAQSQLELVESSAQLATELTQQLLAFSGYGSFIVGRVDLRALVADAKPILQALVRKDCLLELDVSQRVGSVKVDATLVRRVLTNLVVNASEAFDRPGGKITVRVHEELLDDEALSRHAAPAVSPEPGRYVCLQVADDGPGMDPLTQERVFDPFFSTKRQGRGLGLSALDGMVRAHRGVAAIDSGPLGGARVRVWLRVSEGAAPASVPDASGAPSPGGLPKTVFVMDDESLVLNLVTRVLERLDCQVTTARDGEEGLRLLRESDYAFDLILVDLSMPKLGGKAVLEIVRREAPDLPVILMSGYSETKIEKSERVRFLPKPFRPSQLETLLSEMMSERVGVPR